jgi:predicted metalloprotease with PDZ domain
MFRKWTSILVFTTGNSLLAQQVTPLVTRSAASAPISDVRYEVTFNRETAQDQSARIAMTFVATGSDPILLSLPAWTPGAYEISNFARWVLDFSPTAGGKALTWDKLDFDTWRIHRDATAQGPVTVTFTFRADTLDNAMAWSRPDFLFFNGTNLFLYAEGRALAFPSRVTVRTEADWRIATAMQRATEGASSFTASNYHELVDMPFFVGRFDVDSAQVAGKWMRFATYPAGAVQGAARQQAWDQLKRATPPLVAVMGDVPWDAYNVMQIVDTSYQGASGLEHADSHVNVLAPVYIGSEFQPSLYAHEIFHAWNVKRLRPADLVPYRYDVAMPTPWLWMSEGITDYYADLALVRGGIIPDSGFYATTAGKIGEVTAAGSIALEDASLNTWIHPVDGTAYIYYPKGSLAGFMLDIMIRDASDNKQSLDQVMRELYLSTYKQGRGFTSDEWWGAVSRAAGGRSFADFERRYIDGREPFPWTQLLPLAGLTTTRNRVPRIGVTTQQDRRGLLVTEVDSATVAGTAGVRVGDYLLAINDVSITDPAFGAKFQAAFANAREGQPVKILVTRGAQTMTLTGGLRLVEGPIRIIVDPAASPKALRIRNGILRGTTDR